MLKLKEEFAELFNFFDLDDYARVEKFQDTLNETIRFSEKIKERIATGSDEEREELKTFLEEMQAKISKEKEKMFEKLGVSEEDLKAFLNNKENFSEDEWSAMSEMKSYVKDVIDPEEEKPKKQVKAKKSRSKTKWIQS